MQGETAATLAASLTNANLTMVSAPYLEKAFLLPEKPEDLTPMWVEGFVLREYSALRESLGLDSVVRTLQYAATVPPAYHPLENLPSFADEENLYNQEQLRQFMAVIYERMNGYNLVRDEFNRLASVGSQFRMYVDAFVRAVRAFLQDVAMFPESIFGGGRPRERLADRLLEQALSDREMMVLLVRQLTARATEECTSNINLLFRAESSIRLLLTHSSGSQKGNQLQSQPVTESPKWHR